MNTLARWGFVAGEPLTGFALWVVVALQVVVNLGAGVWFSGLVAASAVLGLAFAVPVVAFLSLLGVAAFYLNPPRNTPRWARFALMGVLLLPSVLTVVALVVFVSGGGS